MIFAGKNIHLVGIGGAGVSALVPLLRAAGARVSGCDSADSPTLRRLAAEGIETTVGHHPSHVAEIDMVVHTSAVRPDHPELEAARAAGAVVMTRGECLVGLMDGRRTVAIAGSHGKTTTTWFLGHLLAASGDDPLVMVGGGVAALGGGGARVGRGDWFVAEVDESDGSFARTVPEIAVLTNLDREHLRHWGGMEALEDAVHAWLRAIPASGTAVVPALGLDPRVLDGLRCRVLRVGLEDGDVRATGLELGGEGSSFRVVIGGADCGRIEVPIPGVHMVLNALMACAAARQVHPGCPLTALAGCERVKRRFTVHGNAAGVRVVEDYGHHPAEVRATIAAARLAGGRVHVLFQPHRHSRTADCFGDFAAAFDQAHAVALLPIYAAGEAPEPGITSESLAQAVAARRAGFAGATVAATADPAAAEAHLLAHAEPGDTILVLGAGDVGRLAPALIARLAALPRRPAA